MKKVFALCICVAMMLTFAACKRAVKEPTYTSSVTMYVNNTVTENGEILSSDLTATKSLVDTYIVIIESDTVLEEIIDYAGLSLTTDELREMITGAPINETEVFTVRVTTKDPQLSKDIADAITDIAPAAIARIVEGSNVKIVDMPCLPTRPDKTE